MKLHEASRLLSDRLNDLYGASEAVAIAALALEGVCGLSPAEQRLQKNDELTAQQSAQLEQYTTQLLQHEPIQYILQQAHFYGLNFYVDNQVLIPRSETEELVDWIVRDVRQTHAHLFDRTPLRADGTTELKIMDVGTGSGCIALALKNTIPLAEVWGCDISDLALNTARRNGSLLDIRVDFQSVDFLDSEQQKHLPKIDLLVSNPPYIPQQEAATLSPHVADYEPKLALFVPDEDPLLFYKALASFGRSHLRSPGRIYTETHENTGTQVAALFEAEGYREVTLKKDMQGKDRMVKATLVEG